MSHHRRPRHARCAPNEDVFRRAAAASARAGGCTCDGDLELHRHHVGGNVYVLDVLHHAGCPVLIAGEHSREVDR